MIIIDILFAAQGFMCSLS